MSRRRPTFALTFVLFASACAGVPQADGTLPGRGYGGDELLAAGDFDGAAAAFQGQLDAGSDSPVLREKLANARRRAAMSHASAALRAADAGDADRARAEMSRADSYGADVPAVRDAHAAIDGRLAAASRSVELREQARALMDSNPAQAARLLGEAQALAPEGSDVSTSMVGLRREATLRAEADGSAERAAAAWAARDRGRTLSELAAAQFAGRPVAKAAEVRRRVEQDLVAEASTGDEAALRSAFEFATGAALHPSVVAVLRDRLVDRLLASAQDLRTTRRPATAALLEIEAKQLRADVKTPALDEVRPAVTTVVLVQPFDDATGGKVDGARLARALRERLALDAMGGGLPLAALDDSEAARAAHPDALHLSGRVLSARLTEGRIGRENKTVRYQSGTTRRENPQFAALIAQLAEAAIATRTATDAQKDAVAWLNSVRALNFVRGDGTPRLGDVEYQIRLAAAQTRVDRADRDLSRARDAEFSVRQAIEITPREVDEPVMAEHVVTVTTSAKTAQITAHVDLVAGGETLLAQDVTASAQHKETVGEGFAPAGVAPDPDETPDDASMAAQCADRFAGLAAGRVRAAAEAGALRFLVKARDAERAGRTDEAAEGYAMYLLATPDVFSPERSDAARALGELLGIRVALRATPRKEGP